LSDPRSGSPIFLYSSKFTTSSQNCPVLLSQPTQISRSTFALLCFLVSQGPSTVLPPCFSRTQIFVTSLPPPCLDVGFLLDFLAPNFLFSPLCQNSPLQLIPYSFSYPSLFSFFESPVFPLSWKFPVSVQFFNQPARMPSASQQLFHAASPLILYCFLWKFLLSPPLTITVEVFQSLYPTVFFLIDEDPPP